MLGSSFLFSQEHLEDFERMVLLLLKRVDRGAAQIFVYLETNLMNLYFLYFPMFVYIANESAVNVWYGGNSP